MRPVPAPPSPRPRDRPVDTSRPDALRPDTSRLFGLDFVVAPSIESVVHRVVEMAPHANDAAPHDRVVPIVVTPNVDHLVQRDRRTDDVATAVMERATMVLPDGQPIVWASRLLPTPTIPVRLPGSTLVDTLWPTIVRDGRRALVVANSAASAERVRADGDRVGAVVAPMLDVTDRDALAAFARECVAASTAIDAEFVFVTLGFPKQENVISAMIDLWPTGRRHPVFLAVGASFDMHHGIVRRAPTLVQRIGMEWFFRFAHEPRRLFRRYFVDDMRFLSLLMREWRLRGTPVPGG